MPINKFGSLNFARIFVDFTEKLSKLCLPPRKNQPLPVSRLQVRYQIENYILNQYTAFKTPALPVIPSATEQYGCHELPKSRQSFSEGNFLIYIFEYHFLIRSPRGHPGARGNQEH
jgi:hypothetical protein